MIDASDKRLLEILLSYDGREQVKKAIEELDELEFELLKVLDNSETGVLCFDLAAMVDEIADVLIVTLQMCILFGENKVDERIEYKLNRQIERIREAADAL